MENNTDKKSNISNNKISKTDLPLWNKLLTMFLRVVVGIVFIISGFVKAIDPWGTIYKLNDYFSAMSISLPESLTLMLAFSLFTIEFLLGIFVIFGCYRRVAPLSITMIMAFMLPFTLWIAIANPVADCGCFGDAIRLSNWETFIKNIFITIMAVWLLKYAKKSRCFIIPTMQWLAFASSVIFILLISIYGYLYQPLIDFRPYKIGEELISSSDNENDIEFEFIYTKNGKTVSFTAENIPTDDGWEFVERKEIKTNSNIKIENKQLRIYNEDEEDVSEDIISSEGEQLILFYSSLSDVSIASTYQINSLYSYCNRNQINMISIAATTPEQLLNWKDLSMPSYDIYIAEDTSIKEVVRGNPAIVFLKDGIISWKRTLRSIDIDDFQSDMTSNDVMSFAQDNSYILKSLISSYIIVMIIIVTLSHVPMVVRYARRRNLILKFIQKYILNKKINNKSEKSKTT